MARVAKALNDGFVPTTKGALYSPGTGISTYISLITCKNDNAVTQRVILYVNRSGTSRPIIDVSNFKQNYSFVFGSGLILEEGDTLEGETTTGSAVHFTVSGVEET